MMSCCSNQQLTSWFQSISFHWPETLLSFCDERDWLVCFIHSASQSASQGYQLLKILLRMLLLPGSDCLLLRRTKENRSIVITVTKTEGRDWNGRQTAATAEQKKIWQKQGLRLKTLMSAEKGEDDSSEQRNVKHKKSGFRADGSTFKIEEKDTVFQVKMALCEWAVVVSLEPVDTHTQFKKWQKWKQSLEYKLKTTFNIK